MSLQIRWYKPLVFVVGIAFVLLAAVGGFAPSASARSVSSETGGTFTFVKYGQTFTYNGAGHWTVVNNDNSKAIKNLAGPSDVRPELCTDYDTGLNLPCADGASYAFTSTATFNNESCAYLQIDGGTHGSQDTVPGDDGKRVCSPEPPISACLVTTEFQYSKVVTNSHTEYRFPKETRTVVTNSHTEWRFQTRSHLYKEVEYKDVKGWNFVDGGTVTVNGKVVSGHWVRADANTYYHIPGSVINAVWGQSGIPDSVLGTGTVNLNVYGGPNQSVQYKAYKETVPDDVHYTDWGPWSNWSTTNPGTDTDTRQSQSRTVQDSDTYTDWASAGYTDWSTSSTKPADTTLIRYGAAQTRTVDDPSTTVYYLSGGAPTATLTDTNWTTDTPSSPWTQIHSRTLPTVGDCTPTPPTWVDECGPNNGHWSYANGSWYGFTVTDNRDGSVTITAAASEGHAFTPNTVTSWTRSDSGEACPLPRDASASVQVNPPGCGVSGSVSLGTLTFATLEGTLDARSGDHTATFKSVSGHLFENGADTLQVSYTMLGALPYQYNDETGTCFVEPPHKDDTTTTTEGTWQCDDTTVNVTTITTSYTFDFDEATGTFSEPIAHVGDPVNSTRTLTANESAQGCEPTPPQHCTDALGHQHLAGDTACVLSQTGADDSWKTIGSIALVLLLIGGALVIFTASRVRQQPDSGTR